MTVGIAAITGSDSSNPKVILSADRLLTTTQQSRIEHEHPEAKLEEFALQLNNLNAVGVVAGAVSLADEFTNNIDSIVREQLRQQQQQQQQASGTQPVQQSQSQIDAEFLAKIAKAAYESLIQDKITNNVLSKYGFTLEDLQQQHKFKDNFFRNLMEEVNRVQDVITNNLTLLMGAVDPSGAYIFEISNSDVTTHTRMGYQTIGSGEQPALSEFIRTQYSAQSDFSNGLATVVAANYRAQQASGVGGDMDLAVVGEGYTEFAPDRITAELENRQSTIVDIQSKVKNNMLGHNTINWNPSP